MKFDIHLHSNYSDGANTPEEIIKYAKKIGLAGIAITDHDTARGYLNAIDRNSKNKNFKIIPGVEVTSKEGHILCLNAIPEILPYTPAEEVIEKIHDEGGIAIAAHPYDKFRGGVSDLILKLNFDAIEVFNGRMIMSKKGIEELKKIADKRNIAKTGGSDAHSVREVGNVCIKINENEDPVDAIRKGIVEIVVEGKLKRKFDHLLSFL
ncbi:MAG: metal-dependent phosphoesterase [Candidatus Altiarchaeales archaeon HGW-Altiarchaeales-3]|nr:MAG: metal-dependent phosphoesterase [Candidatus Altiarchaeales archaeon HGW-Altiarchaeales-3]